MSRFREDIAMTNESYWLAKSIELLNIPFSETEMDIFVFMCKKVFFFIFIMFRGISGIPLNGIHYQKIYLYWILSNFII